MILLLSMFTWLTIGVNGVVHKETSQLSSVLGNIPSIASLGLNEPMVVLPLTQTQHQDNGDRVLDISFKNPLGVQVVGLAGPGDVKQTMTPPAPRSFQKWIPDFQPITEKHWDTIVKAIDKTRRESSHSPFHEIYNGQFKDLSNLESQLNGDTTSKRNNLYRQREPSSPQTSTSGLLVPESFNAFRIFLPNHLKQHESQLLNTSNRRNYYHQDSNSQPASRDRSDTKKPVRYVKWPNIGEPSTTTSTDWNDVRRITETLTESEKSQAITKPSFSITTQSTKTRQWPNFTNAPSTPTISVLNSKKDQNLSQTQTWPNLPNKTTGSRSAVTPLNNNGDSSKKLLLKRDNTPLPKPFPTLTPPPPSNSRHSSTSKLNILKTPDRQPGEKIYDQPWLHAAVQHDLKQWGYPYDNDAPPNPYLPPNPSLPLKSSLPPQHHTSQATKPQQSIKSSPQKQKLSSKNNEQLTIVEVDKIPLIGPIPIKNIHVVAPRPGEMPPVPVFRPAEKFSLKSPPYLLPGTESQDPSTTKEPILVVPYQSQTDDDHHDTHDDYNHSGKNEKDTGVYPVLVPLKIAQDRQGTTTLENLMRPFRNIFQLGSRDSRKSTPNRPFKRQIPTPPKPHSDMQPPPLPRQQFPAFGPPKGDDIVSTQENPQQSNEIGIQGDPSLDEQLHDNAHGENVHSQLPTQNENNGEGSHLSPPTLHSQQRPPTAHSPHEHPPQVVPAPQILPAPQVPPAPLVPPAAHPSQFQNEAFFSNKPQTFQDPQLRPPPPPFNKQLPPVLGTVKEETLAAPLPTQPPATEQSFIPWPNLRTSTIPTPNGNAIAQPPPKTTQPQFNIFNQPPQTLAPFRLPNIPNMRFLNPFNMFRGRENPGNKNNGIFSWFPSFLSKNDNVEKERERPNIPRPNQGSSSPGEESALKPPMKEGNTRFLRNIRGNNAKNANNLSLMPHLPAIFPQKTRPPIQNIPNKHLLYLTPPVQYSVADPLVTSPQIHSIPQTEQSENTHTQTEDIHHSLTENNQLDEAIFIVTPNQKENELQNAAVVHPQTNPARVNTFQHEEIKNENLGPDLIKFTLDDVVQQPGSFYITNEEAIANIQPPTTGNLISSTISHTLPTKSLPSPTRSLTSSGKVDMALASSDGVVTVAQAAEPDPTVAPSPTPASYGQFRSTFPSKTTQPSAISQLGKTKDNNAPRKPIFPFRISSLKPHFPIPVTTLSKSTIDTSSIGATTTSTTTTTAAATTTTTTAAPASTSKFVKGIHTLRKAPNTVSAKNSHYSNFQYDTALQESPVTSIFSPNFRPFIIPRNNTSVANLFTSSIKPAINPISRKAQTKPFVNVNWRISQPEDKAPFIASDNQGRSKTQNLFSAASSRVTIIEATPMPKEGEIFPTARDFQAYTPTTSMTTTTVSLPVQTDSIRRTTPTTTTIQSLKLPGNTSPTLSAKPKKQEVLMPGSVNDRSMTKLTKIEPNSMTRSDSGSISRHRQSQVNKFKIKYNAPPRKIFHAHGTEPSLEMATSATSIIPTVVSMVKQDNPTGKPKTVRDAITQASMKNTRSQPPSKVSIIKFNLESKSDPNVSSSQESTISKPSQQEKSTTETSTISTPRPLLAGRPSRYNSLQRLRDFMAGKRKTNPTSTTTATTSPSITPETEKRKLISTTRTPTTPFTTEPHTAYTTRKFRQSSSKKSQQQTTASTTITPTTKMPNQRSNISKLRSPWHTEKSVTRPSPVTPSSQLRKSSDFKEKDYEPSGSHSSHAYEWRPPIHDVNLQDHPEMFDIYNWESTRVREVQEHSDLDSPNYPNSDSKRGSDSLSSDTFNPSPKLLMPVEQSEPVQSSLRMSHFRIPRSSPQITSKSTQRQLSSSTTQVQGQTSSLDHV